MTPPGHPPHLVRTRQLKSQGITDRQLRVEVDAGRLIRLREGSFSSATTHPDYLEAGRRRGRLACISELRRREVFVLDSSRLHLHVAPEAARLQHKSSPHRVHRRLLIRAPHPDSLAVEPIDAVRDSIACQPPRAAIATLDSAIRAALVTDSELDEIFDSLPDRLRPLRALIDPRSESGPETFMRLILKSLGCSFEPQVDLPGVGRVDFLVEGRLVIECDSQAHHAGWEAQRSDRRRDLAAATLGLATLRPVAEDLMWRSAFVKAAVSGVLESRWSQQQDESSPSG